MPYWGILVVVIGLLYGWLKPGRQDKAYMLKVGFLLGVMLALGVALLGAAVDERPLVAVSGGLGIFVEVVLLTLLFTLGVWIGDKIEASRGHA